MATPPHPIAQYPPFSMEQQILLLFKQLLSQLDHPSPSTTGAVLSSGGHQGRVGHDPAGLLSRECAHTFPQPGQPRWGHVWDPPAPQPGRKGSVPPQSSPGTAWVPHPWPLWLPAGTSVIKTWYFACKEQLFRAKSCNAFKRSKPLIPLLSLARTLTRHRLMQTQTPETTFEIKKLYLQICKTALAKTNISKHYKMRMHFPIIRI